MGTYKLSNDAEADLDRIWLPGLKEYGLEQADKYYNALFDRFEALADNPYLHQAVNDIREHYRRSPCGVDTIYYRIDGDCVEIMNSIGSQMLKNGSEKTILKIVWTEAGYFSKECRKSHYEPVSSFSKLE